MNASTTILLALGLLVPVAAAAQEDQRPPTWKRNFDDVQVKQVDPDELPKAEESILPASLAARGALPRPTSLETLRATSARLSDLVIEVIAIPRNDSPVRQSTVVVRGEAVWISAKPGGVDPVLVSNAHWVMDATDVFVRQPERRETGALPTVQRRSVSEMSLGADVKALLRDPNLVKVKVTHVDKHRNLAVLTALPDDLEVPAAGLEFFPIDTEAAPSAYGFSHQMGSTLVLTLFLLPKNEPEELEYYLHTTFPVILGAPIVSADGRVIATTAMRHPADPERTLVIPPRALRKYVVKVQAASAPQDAQPSD